MRLNDLKNLTKQWDSDFYKLSYTYDINGYDNTFSDLLNNIYDYTIKSCISENMLQTTLPKKPSKKCTEEKTMNNFKIKDYKVYNEKIVVVTFEDNTEERAVCCDTDNFDLERGIEVCVLKHVFGRDNYKAFLKNAMKQVKAVDIAKDEANKQKAMIKSKKATAARRKERYKANKRKKRIEEMKEAFVAAMKEYDYTCYDDLK